MEKNCVCASTQTQGLPCFGIVQGLPGAVQQVVYERGHIGDGNLSVTVNIARNASVLSSLGINHDETVGCEITSVKCSGGDEAFSHILGIDSAAYNPGRGWLAESLQS